MIAQDLLFVELAEILSGESQRVFRELRYSTLDSWSRERRVVAKAEAIPGKVNPRFVVTNIAQDEIEGQSLYEDFYCQRGESENRIKEQQLYLFADRTSTRSFRANQLRLWLSSFAYVLLSAIRRLALKDTSLAKARCDTIRLKLLKIGGLVKVTARKIWLSLSSAYPWKDLLVGVWEEQLGEQLRC